MNKVFEVIKHLNIFNLEYNNDIQFYYQYTKSYIHTIIKFKNGFNSKILNT